MQVRHLQNTEEVIEIAQPKQEEQPPLEEIIQFMALLAAIHQTPPAATAPPALPKEKRDEDEPRGPGTS
jgi:hypothetical protein